MHVLRVSLIQKLRVGDAHDRAQTSPPVPPRDRRDNRVKRSIHTQRESERETKRARERTVSLFTLSFPSLSVYGTFLSPQQL